MRIHSKKITKVFNSSFNFCHLHHILVTKIHKSQRIFSENRITNNKQIGIDHSWDQKWFSHLGYFMIWPEFLCTHQMAGRAAMITASQLKEIRFKTFTWNIPPYSVQNKKGNVTQQCLDCNHEIEKHCIILASLPNMTKPSTFWSCLNKGLHKSLSTCTHNLDRSILSAMEST